MKRAVFIVALIGAAAAGAVLYLKYTAADPTTSFRTAAIRYGDLLSTIGATGTVEPEEVVDVGAQVMGSILGFGTDPQNPTKLVDYGCVVEKGTVLARIDPAIYEAQKKSAEAALVSAKADLPQKIAQLAQATADWGRAQKLSGTIQQAEYDQFKAAYEVAMANVEISKANIGVALANLETAQTNLNYTTIKSPVRGVIVDRRMNIGQTVVASLNAPSLFLIAKDLRRIAGVGLSQRSRHRPHSRGYARALHRRYFSRRSVSRQGVSNPPERHHDAERRHLYRRRDDGQYQRQVAALSDGEPSI